MFKQLQLYRLRPGITAEALATALASQAFAELTGSDLMRSGWVAPRGGELVHVVHGQWLLNLRTDKRLLPSKVVNEAAKARALELEDQQGFYPGKKAMKEIKERVFDEMLPKAFVQPSVTQVWIDPKGGWLCVDGTASKADDVIKHLLKAVDRLPVESLRVKRSPVSVMTEWLNEDEAPACFTIDQDATIRAAGENKASVTYKRSLQADDVRRHIAAGKQCVKLAMTWDSKISFVLTEALDLKSIKPLDILKENEASTRNDEERFDGDFALTTGELSKLLADLVEALGGEADSDAPVETASMIGLMREHGATIEKVTVGDVPVGDGSAADPLYNQAVTVVRTHQRGSISLVQRHLRIGYNRAARLLETMEHAGVLSPMASNGNREVLAARVTP